MINDAQNLRYNIRLFIVTYVRHICDCIPVPVLKSATHTSSHDKYR